MCHMSISYLYTSIAMANLNNSIPQLPPSLHISGSAVFNHDNYDRSLLSDIDPDFNYLCNNRTVNSDYYNEQEFNRKFSNNSSSSLIHLNSRSVPLHFNEFLCYLDTLDIEFKMIALSETAINSTHTQWRSEGIWRPGANLNFAPPPLKKFLKYDNKMSSIQLILCIIISA